MASLSTRTKIFSVLCPSTNTIISARGGALCSLVPSLQPSSVCVGL
jgi:hypothetical protein